MIATKKSVLAELEARAEECFKLAEDNWIEGAAILQRIREEKHFRSAGMTWPQYCKNRWAKSFQRINRIIASASAMIEGNVPTGTNERQARELMRLAPSDRAAALAAAGPNPTTDDVADSVDDRLADLLDAMTPEQQEEAIRAEHVAVDHRRHDRQRAADNQWQEKQATKLAKACKRLRGKSPSLLDDALTVELRANHPDHPTWERLMDLEAVAAHAINKPGVGAGDKAILSILDKSIAAVKARLAKCA